MHALDYITRRSTYDQIECSCQLSLGWIARANRIFSVSGPNLSASNAAAGRSKIGFHSALGSNYSASLLSDTHG
jgi:hypothetical protein